MVFDKRTLVLPDGTTFEERTIVTNGDVIVGNHVKSGFGFKTDGRLFAGQGVQVEGDLHCDGDLRMDQSSSVDGELTSGGNIYLGERCFVSGDLSLEGDLDVGDDVKIGGALHAKGWVNKRNPVPLVIYLFIYVLELLRMGQSEEVERILKEMEEGESDDIAVSDTFLFIPDNSGIGLQASQIQGGLHAGSQCRILGNLEVEGDVHLGAGTQVFGALRATGSVTMDPECEVQGALKALGHVTVGQGCQVLGDLAAESVKMYPSATIDGKVLAEGGVEFCSEEQARLTAEEKVDEFDSKKADLVDLLG